MTMMTTTDDEDVAAAEERANRWVSSTHARHEWLDSLSNVTLFDGYRIDSIDPLRDFGWAATLDHAAKSHMPPPTADMIRECVIEVFGKDAYDDPMMNSRIYVQAFIFECVRIWIGEKLDELM